MSDRKFIVVITQTIGEAAALNAIFPPATSGFRISAYHYGYAFCGLNHYGMRPNVLISSIPLDGNDRWVRECLRPAFQNEVRIEPVEITSAYEDRGVLYVGQRVDWFELRDMSPQDRAKLFAEHFESLAELLTLYPESYVTFDKDWQVYYARVGKSEPFHFAYGYAADPNDALMFAALAYKLT